MSAFGVTPLLDGLRHQADPGLLERQLSALPARLRWLFWVCGVQLALMLLLDVMVYFPEILMNGPQP
jgi:hypothetical protein